MVQFLGGFESAIYTLRKELISPDIYKIFEIKKWLNINSKPDNKCERGGDVI
jgi:hypothetical protein